MSILVAKLLTFPCQKIQRHPKFATLLRATPSLQLQCTPFAFDTELMGTEHGVPWSVVLHGPHQEVRALVDGAQEDDDGYRVIIERPVGVHICQILRGLEFPRKLTAGTGP